MGVSFYAKAIMATPMEAIYNRITHEETQIRYNEVTGKPYDINVKVSIHWMGQKQYTQKEWDEFNQCDNTITFPHPMDPDQVLEITTQLYRNRTGGQSRELYGVEILSCAPGEAKSTPIHNLLAIQTALMAKLRELFDYHGPVPELYIVNRVC